MNQPEFINRGCSEFSGESSLLEGPPPPPPPPSFFGFIFPGSTIFGASLCGQAVVDTNSVSVMCKAFGLGDPDQGHGWFPDRCSLQPYFFEVTQTMFFLGICMEVSREKGNHSSLQPPPWSWVCLSLAGNQHLRKNNNS